MKKNNTPGKQARAAKAACQMTDFRKIVSKHTGKTLVENLSEDLLLIPDHWTAEGCAQAIERWRECKAGNAQKRPFSKAFIEAVDSLSKTASRGEFGERLGNLILVNFQGPGTDPTRDLKATLIELLICLWESGCVIWPRKNGVLGMAVIKRDSLAWGAARKVIDDIFSSFVAPDERQEVVRFRSFAKFILSRSPARSLLDICPDGQPRALAKIELTTFRFVAKTIISLQRRDLPGSSAYRSEDFVVRAGKPLPRQDADFLWVTESEKGLELWRVEATAFLKQRSSGRERCVAAINSWFDYLKANPAAPRNPIEMLELKNQKGCPPLPSGTRHFDKVRKLIGEFFDFILVSHCASADDGGAPRLLPGYRNPILELGSTRQAKPFETHRQPMPTRFINLCFQILTENDFAWAKQAKGNGGDWIKWNNPETKEMEDVWCPVRCYLMLLKLILPARGIQLRLLDSGEADSERYDPKTRAWSTNSGPLASSRGRTQKGVFRKYFRNDGSAGSLIYFNTNKTADIDAPVDGRGYVMPWEHQKALEIFAALRAWQEKYNPLSRLTPWSEVDEFRLRDPGELRQMGTACFLFRDATNREHPGLPITDGKLQSIWTKLMSELEDRLFKCGDRMPDGSRMEIVTGRDERGFPSKILFDLHSLRVTIITALYEEGAPPEHIMKVVGHASVLMTLYYVKLAGDDVTKTLNDAWDRRHEGEQANWISFLGKQERSELRQLTAWTNESAVDALVGARQAGMVVMDHGFCPVGARRCQDGLVTVDNSSGSSRFTPVPGGSSNCARCRFFVTGPAFLPGMVAHVNDLSYRAKHKSGRYQAAQDKFETISMEQARAIEQGDIFPSQKVQAAEAARELARGEIDEVALSFQAAYRLVEQSLDILNKQPADQQSKFSLVVPSGFGERIEAHLEETTEFEQLQRVCESAAMFERLQIDSLQPNLERMRLFDKMLANNELPPFFCSIDDDELALRIGNEVGRFFQARISKSDLGLLMRGKTTLLALGVKEALPKALRDAEAALSAPQRGAEARALPVDGGLL